MTITNNTLELLIEDQVHIARARKRAMRHEAMSDMAVLDEISRELDERIALNEQTDDGFKLPANKWWREKWFSDYPVDPAVARGIERLLRNHE